MRVLIVDDSTLFRKVVRDALADCPGIEVVGLASNGKSALDKIPCLQPDVVTLDVEMPELDGMEVLKQLRQQSRRPEVIMLSAMTDRGALATTQALRLGAFDFILKPNHDSLEANCQQLRQDLLPIIRLLQQRHEGELGSSATVDHRETESPAPKRRQAALASVKVVGIGVSTGGPAALNQLLPKLPADLAVPLLIVQHMPPVFTRSLAADLDRASRIKVCEAEDGQEPLPGHAYLAPGGKQMKILSHQGHDVIQITNDPPERSCKPSVDYLFRSLAHTFGSQAMGVVMTGMGDDGTLGCRLMKRHGCTIVAQEESSCVVYGMPRQVIDAGLADIVVPLDQLHEIIQVAGTQGARKCR